MIIGGKGFLFTLGHPLENSPCYPPISGPDTPVRALLACCSLSHFPLTLDCNYLDTCHFIYQALGYIMAISWFALLTASLFMRSSVSGIEGEWVMRRKEDKQATKKRMKEGKSPI